MKSLRILKVINLWRCFEGLNKIFMGSKYIKLFVPLAHKSSPDQMKEINKIFPMRYSEGKTKLV